MNPAPHDQQPQSPVRAAKISIFCPSCSLETEVTGDRSICTQCNKAITVRHFPRSTNGLLETQNSGLASDSEATCQFFPEYKAEVVCDECGCFMSHQAAVDLDDGQFCLPCVHRLRESKGGDSAFRPEQRIWDNLALFLIALVPITLFTAPISLFCLLRFRKAPRGWVPRSSFRWWLAMILSIGFLLFWLAVCVFWVSLVAQELRS